MAEQKPLADELLIGAIAIGEFYGVNARVAFYMCEKGLIPVFKIGSRWAGRTSTFIRDIERREKSGSGALAIPNARAGA